MSVLSLSVRCLERLPSFKALLFLPGFPDDHDDVLLHLSLSPYISPFLPLCQFGGTRELGPVSGPPEGQSLSALGQSVESGADHRRCEATLEGGSGHRYTGTTSASKKS